MGLEDTTELTGEHTRQLPRTKAIRNTRRILVGILGGLLIGLGLALIPLPGPFTIPLVLVGLTVLSWEFRWAKRLLFSVKTRLRKLRRKKR